jgi:hypothetical protein
VSEAVSVLERHGVSVSKGPGAAFTIKRLAPPPPVLDIIILKPVVSDLMIDWLCERFPDIDKAEFYKERLTLN